jgi:dTDP-4-amino-4,6-dideoxygalactose transaminase
MPIKFVDLAAQNVEIRRRVDEEHGRIHAASAYIGGAQVAEFESHFSQYLGVKHVVAVGSGTDALRLALLAAGIGRGDEVITTPMTFIATVEAIVQSGAVPVLSMSIRTPATSARRPSRAISRREPFAHSMVQKPFFRCIFTGSRWL